MTHPTTIIRSKWFKPTHTLVNIPEPCLIVIDEPRVFSDTLPTVFYQVEPTSIVNHEDYLITNAHKYHTIFTYCERVLNNCRNAKKYVYGTSFIPRAIYDNIDISKKRYAISHLAGSKNCNNSTGHLLRQEIHHNQHMFKTNCPITFTFYRSIAQIPHIKDYGNNPFIGHLAESKYELFESYQFAFVIENSRQINYFTEKLMDCLLTKTIPIYYGCPNISDYFDTSGWIIIDSSDLNTIQTKLASLVPTYYESYKDVIESNHTKAKQYVDLYTNLNNAV